MPKINLKKSNKPTDSNCMIIQHALVVTLISTLVIILPGLLTVTLLCVAYRKLTQKKLIPVKVDKKVVR